MAIIIKDLNQLKAVNETLINCGNVLANKSDELEVLQRELNQWWEDSKGDEFREVIRLLLQLNDEALDQLGQECRKLTAYIEGQESAQGVEVKQ